MILEKIDFTFNPEKNYFSRMEYVFSVPEDNTQQKESVKSAFDKLDKMLEEIICKPNSLLYSIFGDGVKKEEFLRVTSDSEIFGYLYKRSYETPGGLNRGKFSVDLRYKINMPGSNSPKSEISLDHLVEKSSGPEYKNIKKLYDKIITCQDITIGSEAQKVIEQINSILQDHNL